MRNPNTEYPKPNIPLPLLSKRYLNLMWLPLTQPEQLTAIAEESHAHPVLIFKHSTTCSISAAAKAKLERQWADSGLTSMPIYYLDLLRFRPLSAQIAEQFGIRHESPQLLLIQDGTCTYDASHMGIRLAEVKQAVGAQQ
jgi:bacillithiol system protein YtxJ